MKLVIQRVRSAWVSAEGNEVARIGPGALILLGVARGDTEAEADWLAAKTARLRIYDDGDGRLNAPITAIGGAFLVVSQFTLLGNANKGNRPSYMDAAPPAQARTLYEYYADRLARCSGRPVQRGRFQQHMLVGLENDGPVTLVLERPGPDPAPPQH